MGETTERRYKFSWELIGDIEEGRPNLGPNTSLVMYRLMQFMFRDVLEEKYGTEQTDNLFKEAGKKAGMEVYKQYCQEVTDLNSFVITLQNLLKELGIGIMRVESANPEKGNFIITVAEDLDCSGLPELDYEICTFDEGFIAGLMESFTGKKFVVKEIDCWCTGDRTCRFTADAVE